MPHIIVKFAYGRTEEQKARVAEEITKAMMTAIGSEESNVSVSI